MNAANSSSVAIPPSISAKLANMSFASALLVVVIHTISIPVEESVARYLTLVLRYSLTTVAVQWFFFCSGYLLAGKFGEKGWYGSACRKRVHSLLVPYLFWTVVLFGISGNVCQMIRGEAVSGFVDHLKGIVISPRCGHLWYVRNLIMLVLLAPLIKGFCQRGWFVLVCFAVYLGINPGYVDGHWFFSSKVYYVTWHFFSLQGLAYFVFGAFVRERNLERRKWWDALAAFVWIVGTGCVLVLVRNKLPFSVCGISPIPFVIAAGMWLLWRIMPDQRLQFCHLSFPIYILHVLFCWQWLPVLWQDQSWLMNFIITLVLTIGVAFLLRHTFPKFYKFAFGGR